MTSIELLLGALVFGAHGRISFAEDSNVEGWLYTAGSILLLVLSFFN